MSLTRTTVLTLVYSVLSTWVHAILMNPIYAAEAGPKAWGFHHGQDHYRLVWKDPAHLSISRMEDGKELAECVKIQMVKESSQVQVAVDLECKSTSIAAFKTLATYMPATMTEPQPEIRFGNWIGGYHGFGLSPVAEAEVYAKNP